MANVDEYVEAIRNAIYGREVRGAIADAIEAMNVESTAAYSAAITAQNSASNSAASALSYKQDAETAYSNTQNLSGIAKSWAVGPNGSESTRGTDTNNAYWWYSQTANLVQGAGGIIPMGPVTFENLPTSNIQVGYMYNITNEFTTDSRFVEGSGHKMPAGVNVYYTSDGKWDLFVGEFIAPIPNSFIDSLFE